MAKLLRISERKLREWCLAGRMKATRINDKNDSVYAPLDQQSEDIQALARYDQTGGPPSTFPPIAATGSVDAV